ncbi:MAG: HAD hydrolase-like protein [Planctomycetota bacterium]|nr:HAD hydrolase-like protein [Planctomycetota bacterium]
MTQHEANYQRVVDSVESTRFLDGSAVEIIREPRREQPPRYALFDFDGTLSLIREGWPEVMVPMMVEALQATETDESAEELEQLAREFVGELTGKQTIYQMIRLVEEIERRGGRAEDAAVYKQRYHDLLMERITERREALRAGRADAEGMLVPGSVELLDELARRGVRLYLASGTDEQYVVEEVRLLGLDKYFGAHIYGAQEDYKSFSKAMVIERILSENNVPGELLLGFGDGYVEIQNVKEAGGIAVGVASNETERNGKPDEWKRDRLIGVGADLVVPDFGDWKPLVEFIWSE